MERSDILNDLWYILKDLQCDECPLEGACNMLHKEDIKKDINICKIINYKMYE